MISIITAARIDSQEKADWLQQAIQSIQQQTIKEWEMVIIDDNSPISIQVPDDKRIRLLKTVEQFGPARARNTGVAVASFDAILPLDADDQLATNRTLEIMYDAWAQNKSRVVYGDIQRLEIVEDKWRIAKVINLPEYTFELSLKLSGIIPVTAMHSKECHVATGGWKPELEFGLEDVEYWIGAGKAGFCGHHVPEITLLYRKHDLSRHHRLRYIVQQETAMRAVIRNMHEDVYSGRYPMGCCGGRSHTPSQQSVSTQFTELSNVENKVIVQYVGRRSGSWGLRGDSNIVYVIQGPGHKLEISVKDLEKFRRHGRGKDFSIGVPKPTDNGQQPQQQQELNMAVFQGPKPELAMIERMDR